MLKSLFIRNFVLIDSLDIKFDKGFSVITGETGAGKSIILGALSLVLGQRADGKSIKNGSEKCVIEAVFDVSRYKLEEFFLTNDLEYDAEICILRRELFASGKSRAFVNDSPVPLSVVKELGSRLIDIHSQHQNLLLNKEGFQLNVLDILAHNLPKGIQPIPVSEKGTERVDRKGSPDQAGGRLCTFSVGAVGRCRFGCR